MSARRWEFPNVLAVFKEGEALTESQLANAKWSDRYRQYRSKKVVVSSSSARSSTSARSASPVFHGIAGERDRGLET